MPQKGDPLFVGWCSHKAAKTAVMRWHYSKRMPIGKLLRMGVWEHGRFVGAVLLGRGANNRLGAAYDLAQREVCELVRIALRDHKATVSRIVRVCLAMLRAKEQSMRLVVSFADPMQGHHGGVYQAGGWLYSGRSTSIRQVFHEGRWKHQREFTAGAFGGKRRLSVDAVKALPMRTVPGKLRYLMPLDKAMRRKLLPLAKPYPKPEDAQRILRGGRA